MRSDSAPLGIYCRSAAAKVSPSYVYMAREESRGRLGASRRVLHTEQVIAALFGDRNNYYQ